MKTIKQRSPISSAIKTKKLNILLPNFENPTKNEIDWPEIMEDRRRRDLERKIEIGTRTGCWPHSWVSFSSASLGSPFLSFKLRPTRLPLLLYYYFLCHDMEIFSQSESFKVLQIFIIVGKNFILHMSHYKICQIISASQSFFKMLKISQDA